MMMRLVCFCLLLAAPVHALTASTSSAHHTEVPLKRCELYYYYDHGTDKCEFCCDICCNAQQKATTKQCDEECPEYAKKLQADAKKIQDDTQDVETDAKNGQKAPWGQLPLALQIAIPLMGCVLILLLCLLFLKRQAIISKFRMWRAAASSSVRGRPVPELVPLQQVTSQQPTTNSRELDLPVWNQREHPDPSSSSSSSSPIPSGGRSTTVTRQECPSSHMGTPQQTASYHPEASCQPSSPVEESMEGRLGPSVMKLPNNRTTDTTQVKTIAADSQTETIA